MQRKSLGTNTKIDRRASRPGRRLAALIAGIVLAHGAAQADTMRLRAETLPTGRYGTSAIWDGEAAYVFGGTNTANVNLNEILRFDPEDGSVTKMNALLPSGLQSSSAVWTGSEAYIFGGGHRILRYDPSQDQVQIMGATIPGRRLASAVWDGRYAYVFGGENFQGGYYDDIIRYDPVTDTAVATGATLPITRGYTSAVWDGRYAFVFGGLGRQGQTNLFFQDILRYDPQTNSVATMPTQLPRANYGIPAFWDGHHAFALSHFDLINRYATATDVVTVMSQASGRTFYASAVWTGTRALFFGGYNSFNHTALDQIREYDLSPAAPQNLTATPGPGADEISLQWQAPPHNTYSHLDGYLVSRGDEPGAQQPLASVGDVQAYTDSGLPSSAERYYRVRALSPSGAGPDSNEAGAITPGLCHSGGTCDPATASCSVVNEPNGTACDDGDACTLADSCQAGSCVGGASTLLEPLVDPEQTVECLLETVSGLS